MSIDYTKLLRYLKGLQWQAQVDNLMTDALSSYNQYLIDLNIIPKGLEETLPYYGGTTNAPISNKEEKVKEDAFNASSFIDPVFDMGSGFFRNATDPTATLTEKNLRQGWDVAANAVSTINPVIGTAMKGTGLAYDAINYFGAEESDNLLFDPYTMGIVGGSYQGVANKASELQNLEGKKFGLFNKARLLRVNNAIAKANQLMNTMSTIAENAQDWDTLGNQMSGFKKILAEYSLNGGYDQSKVLAAKHGIKIELDEWKPVIDIEEVVCYKEGGKQMNVIPEGALHKNKHNLKDIGYDDSEITKKGIPVVDNNGNQQAEIELNEIIFTLEVTKLLEEMYHKYYNEDTATKDKDSLALKAGKLLWKEILYNTDDRTGLIDTLKEGGVIKAQEGTKLPEFKTYTDLTDYLGADRISNDYDLESAYNDAEVYNNWRETESKNPGLGHWQDKYKKPNHMTFSTESIYSKDNIIGGEWKELPDKTWSFTVSPHLMSQHSFEDYIKYFDKNEPGNTVIYGDLLYTAKLNEQ